MGVRNHSARSQLHALLTAKNGLSALLLGAVLVSCLSAVSCKRGQRTPAEAPSKPTLRLYFTSTIAGAMEPCGCRKDMLGGIDHAAALVQKARTEAPNSLVVGAGPMLFLNPTVSDEKKAQDSWKAESLAESLADLKLVAWAPGANDFALGKPTLAKLARVSNAELLAANVQAPGVPLGSVRVVRSGGVKVGIAGVSTPRHQGKLPTGLNLADARAALASSFSRLTEQGAQLLVALVALPRGEALRLAELVPGFHVVVVGKPSDAGEGNDAPTPPVRIGQTLVVEAPNHLQALGVVDLYVRGDDFSFADGSGIEIKEKQASLNRRIQELELRLQRWRQSGAVNAKDLKAREVDLAALKREHAALSVPVIPKNASFFRYELREVREGLGSDERVSGRMREYYRRVNEHNRVALRSRKPESAAPGKQSFAGGKSCVECHQEADAFWKTTGHAHAYQTLVDDFKEFNLDCVGCHVTGYERPGGSTVTFVEGLKDVQCESCHGAASRHVKEEDSDRVTLTPAQSVCRGCHHPPHVADDWDIKAAWQKIIGPGHGEPVQ